MFALTSVGVVGIVEAPLQNSPQSTRLPNYAPDRDSSRPQPASLRPVPAWPAGLDSSSYARLVAAIIVLLTIAKFVVAAVTPLSFDEALYWRYSLHLAPGFMDHPFMNPLMIRVGTSLFGQTPFGVRFMSVLLGLPASWAVWRTSLVLFDDRKLATTAALFFNLTVVMTAGAVVATSDQIVVVTTCFLMLTLAELNRSGQGAWWVAVGFVFGLGLCSKYTTVFFAVSILAWLLIVPSQRRWLLSYWPWLGGAAALAVFSPVLIWNAEHQWASVVYQSGRLAILGWSTRYVAELIAAAVILATPPIFVLAVVGFAKLCERNLPTASSRILVVAMVAPMTAYFIWHATHERVQANWIEPIYPALAIAAAWAAQHPRPGSDSWVRWSRRLASSIAFALAAFIYVEAAIGILPLRGHSPRDRVLAVGWSDLAKEVEKVRLDIGAKAILTTDYTVASWGKFYLPRDTSIEQVNQRLRWINEPVPNPELFKGPTLYLCRGDCAKVIDIRRRYRKVDLIESIKRKDGLYDIGSYSMYRLSDPVGPTFDLATVAQIADRDD